MPSMQLFICLSAKGHIMRHKGVPFINWHKGLVAGYHLFAFIGELRCCCCQHEYIIARYHNRFNYLVLFYASICLLLLCFHLLNKSPQWKIAIKSRNHSLNIIILAKSQIMFQPKKSTILWKEIPLSIVNEFHQIYYKIQVMKIANFNIVVIFR